MKKSFLLAIALVAAGLCTSHGMEGKGDTKMGEKLGVQDLTDAKVQAAFTDEKAFDSIKNGLTKDGKKLMVAYSSRLSDDEIHALVAYIRTLKKD